MNRSAFLVASLAVGLMTISSRSAVFPVQGAGATGQPGDRVFIELEYQYGEGFGVIAEDFHFEYQFANMTFVPEASSIGLLKDSPESLTSPNLVQYPERLRQLANAHLGTVLVNPNVPGSTPDFKGYTLSFYTADGTAHLREGTVQLRVAFDIAVTAPPGSSKVSFTDRNVLVNEDGDEFSYPAELENLSVTVVPEPALAWIPLTGVALGLAVMRMMGRGKTISSNP